MDKAPPFKICIDSRERLPYKFPGFDTVVRKIDAGDYSLELPDGSLAPVAVERKSHSDLWGSMGEGRARFERCVKRLAKLDHAVIIVECTLAEAVVAPKQIQRLQASSVIGGLISWSVQYGVHTVYVGSREAGERYVVRFLAAWYKHKSGLWKAR
jgi:ERCC4-type nuclease